MGQLADRLRDLMREYGWDPSARDAELSALEALEAQDAKAAHERFLELRRAFAVRHRADLLAELRAFPFVRDVPPADARGMGLKEVESEARALARALAYARDAQRALDEEAAARASLASRGLAPAPALQPAPWDRLAPLADAAEARRRVAAREARVEARARDLVRRAAKAGVPAPETSGLAADAADAALDDVERAVRAAEALREAHDAATRPLRDAAVAEWTRESRRALQREADKALDAGDLSALEALRGRAEALRAEAARKSEAAARARRRGERAPERERRAGDALDGYG